MPPKVYRAVYLFRFVDGDPDGRPCDDCGSPIFLKARAMEGRYEGGAEEWEHHATFCASCANCREDGSEYEEVEGV